MTLSFIQKLLTQQNKALARLRFSSPVEFIYNPLDYAAPAFLQYWQRYAHKGVETVLLGMNPGPWGMAQTGVPFGEVGFVKEWMGIEAKIGKPKKEHPKRIIAGLECTRSEVSGKRLWGWARDQFGTAPKFFKKFFVLNYCPLIFLEASGKNRPPNVLPTAEQKKLAAICDESLRQTIAYLKPQRVIGVGQFAYKRALSVLDSDAYQIGVITHPSPANPKANKGWAGVIAKEMAGMGVRLPSP